MENKQTAVDWLYDRFLFAGYAIPSQWKEQAKVMEKDQIKDAYINGITKEKTSEEYYEETYGK